LASCSAARIGAVLTLLVMTCLSARADGIGVGGCVSARSAVNCVVRWGGAGDPYVREVPQPVTEAEKARATARENKWLHRCRPVIEQDGYGVPRYRYSAPGCEYGVVE
jgi:hypothetical protein